MNRAAVIVLALVVALLSGFVVGRRQQPVPVPAGGAAAVPDQKGGQDIFGAYDVAANWPKPLTDLPDHQKWTYSAVESIYARPRPGANPDFRVGIPVSSAWKKT